MTMSESTSRRSGLIAALLYLLLWALSTFYLYRAGADWSFPIISLGIFGIALSGLAWVLTRRSNAPAVPVARPRIEAAALLLYLLFYAFVVLGWAMGAVKAAVPPGQAQELATLALKLLVHVVGPIGLLLLLRAPIRAMFDTGLSRPGFWPTLIVLGAILLGLLAVVSPSLSQIAALGLAPPALALGVVGAFVWIALEAGLCEEFLFRAALQSRLAALLESPAAAIVVTSLLFALAHAPGLYLRGTPETDGWSTDPLQVAAFTIATLSPISILFGILWARTRSLLLVVLLHAAIDVLPFTAEFVKTWG
jgi:membrane protease YdiL (CAAX protease family)